MTEKPLHEWTDEEVTQLLADGVEAWSYRNLAGGDGYQFAMDLIHRLRQAERRAALMEAANDTLIGGSLFYGSPVGSMLRGYADEKYPKQDGG